MLRYIKIANFATELKSKTRSVEPDDKSDGNVSQMRESWQRLLCVVPLLEPDPVWTGCVPAADAPPTWRTSTISCSGQSNLRPPDIHQSK